MIGNKADLLLQAIQRTADAHGSNDGSDNENDNIFNDKSHSDSPAAGPSSATTTGERKSDCDNNNYLMNNKNVDKENDDGASEGAAALEAEGDCRLCKRQKTRHNYVSSMSVSSTSSGGSYRRTMSECLVGLNSPDGDDDETDGAMSFSPLPNHNCDDSEFNYSTTVQMSNADDDYNLSYGELKAYRRAFSEDVINQLPGEAGCFSEDKCHCDKLKAAESPSILKLTPNVNLLYQREYVTRSSAMSPHKKLLVNSNNNISSISNNNKQQKIPKINLSQVFNAIHNNDSGIGQDCVESPTSDGVFSYNCSSPASSYPPMQLSPRFRGTNSMLKRRSRHLSDRSSISEYSNAEDISGDEDESTKSTNEKLPIAKQLLSPPILSTPPPPPTAKSSASKISSLYKFVNKTQAAFNKLPLLGTIEESLLRDRFQPKAIVGGFKLLLGASGSFCPTQLTIPAQTFFYEFRGMKHMSTPYVVSSL